MTTLLVHSAGALVTASVCFAMIAIVIQWGVADGGCTVGEEDVQTRKRMMHGTAIYTAVARGGIVCCVEKLNIVCQLVLGWSVPTLSTWCLVKALTT